MQGYSKAKAAAMAAVAVLGTSCVQAAAQETAYWGEQDKPLSYEEYWQKEENNQHTHAGEAVYVAKYSDKRDGSLTGKSLDFSEGLIAYGHSDAANNKAGSVTIFGVDAEEGLSDANINAGSVIAKQLYAPDFWGGDATAVAISLNGGSGVHITSGQDMIFVLTNDTGDVGADMPGIRAASSFLMAQNTKNLTIDMQYQDIKGFIQSSSAASNSASGGRAVACDMYFADAEGLQIKNVERLVACAGVSYGSGAGGGSAEAVALELSNVNGVTADIEAMLAVASYSGMAQEAQSTGGRAEAVGLQANYVTGGTLTTGRILAMADGFDAWYEGNAISGRSAQAKGAELFGSELVLASGRDLNIMATAVRANDRGGDFVCGNGAVAAQEAESNITYNVAGRLRIVADATSQSAFGASEEVGLAAAVGQALSNGSTAINAAGVAVVAESAAANASVSLAYGMELAGHSLHINAADAQQGVAIKANAGAIDEQQAEGMAVGIDALNSAIDINTAGAFTVNAAQSVAQQYGNEAAHATAISLNKSGLNAAAAGGIAISASHAVSGDAENERSLHAVDSVITLDAGNTNKVIFSGNAELESSRLQLLSDTEVNSGTAGDGSLFIRGQAADGNVSSALHLLQNARDLQVAGFATFSNTDLYFYDKTDINSSEFGSADNSFRKIAVGANLKLGGEDSLYIRTNSLKGDAGDRIIVAGNAASVDNAAAAAADIALAGSEIDTAGAAADNTTATVNINVFDEGMKIGYNAQKDGKGWVEAEGAEPTFDGKGFGADGNGAITVISAAESFDSNVTIGDVTAVSYDNGVWSYEYEVQAEKSDDGKSIQLTKVATTRAEAGSAQKTAGDANKIAAAAAVSLFGSDETLHERLGDIRALRDANAKDENVWAKYVGGRLKTDGIGGGDAKVKYNGVEIGYDSYVGNNWIVGVAGEYVKGSSTLTSGSGDVKTTAGAVYGTWLGEKGHHLDIIGKIGRVDSETTSIGDTIANKMEGDFDANAYSLSVEYGYKYDLDNNWYVAPAARLSYVHMGSADYSVKALNNTMHAQNDSFSSLVLRAGARIGTNLGSKGSLYFKLAALYDFDGDVATTLTADGRSNRYETELGGFGLEYGLGYDQSFGKNSSLYLDVERVSGGDLKKDWGVNAGLRFSF